MASPREPGEGQLIGGEILTMDLGFLLLLPFLELTLHLVQLLLVEVLQDVSDGLWEWGGGALAHHHHPTTPPPPLPLVLPKQGPSENSVLPQRSPQTQPHTGAHTSCVPGATPFLGERC